MEIYTRPSFKNQINSVLFEVCRDKKTLCLKMNNPVINWTYDLPYGKRDTRFTSFMNNNNVAINNNYVKSGLCVVGKIFFSYSTLYH